MILRLLWLFLTRPLACRRQVDIGDLPDGSTAIRINGVWTVIGGDYGGFA